MQFRWSWNRWPLALIVFFLAAPAALAHEKWYVDEHAIPPGPPIFLRVSLEFALIAVVVAFALFVGAVWLDRRLDKGKLMRWFDERMARSRINPHAVLGALLGASLMGAGLQHTLFAPNLELPATFVGAAVAVCEIGLGTLFLFMEPFYPELGIALLALFMVGFRFFEAHDLLEELMLPGIALFFIANETVRAPWRKWNTPERRRQGYHAFRILTGLNFLILSTVKWLRPELALTIVQQYHINFLWWLHVSDLQFIFFAAIVETAVAFCLLLRVAFRPAIFVSFVFFTLSIYFLGFRELLGHLPIKATLFLFFVYGHWHKGETKP